MENKKILVGAGLIGASLFLLPKISGEETQTFSSGGGGGSYSVPSVSQVGLPAGSSSVEGTKKEGSVTYVIEAPDFPKDNGVSTLTAPTKKETTTSGYQSASSVIPSGNIEEALKKSAGATQPPSGGVFTKIPASEITKKIPTPAPSTFSNIVSKIGGWAGRFGLGLW